MKTSILWPLCLIFSLLTLACGAAPVDLVDAGAVDAGVEDASTADAAPAPDMTAGSKCSAANCGGCCEGDICQTGITSSACGSKGAACVKCSPTEACNTAGMCLDTLAGMYEVTVVDASIDSRTPAGLCWDLPCGAPDPFFQMNGRSTQTISDTYSPRWHSAFTVSYAELSGGLVSFRIWDEDVSSHDVITPSTSLKATDAEIKAGRFTVARAGSAFSISFTVKKL